MASKLIFDEHDRLGRWVCDQVGGKYTDEVCIGLESDGRLIVAAMYNDYNGASMRMHVAANSPAWLAQHRFLCFAFGYPFLQLGCNLVIGIVDSENIRARRADEWLGFELAACLPRAGRHGDMLIYTLRRERCRFIGKYYGQ